MKQLYYLILVAACLVGCNHKIGHQDSACSLSLKTMDVDSLHKEDSLAMERFRRSLTPHQSKALLKEYQTWCLLRNELEEFCYVVLTQPKCYQGSIGRNIFQSAQERLSFLHSELYKKEGRISSDSIQPTHYVYIEQAEELFLACCQATIDRQLPALEKGSYYTQEQEVEILQCRKNACSSLKTLERYIKKWIEAREKLSASLCDVPVDSIYISPRFIEHNTSEIIINLSKLVSLP